MTETICPKCGCKFDTAYEIPTPILHSSQESYEKHRILENSNKK